MAKRIDMTGKTYGHLTVRGLAEKVKGVRARLWVCECGACSGERSFSGAVLRSGAVTSCGCRPLLNLAGWKLVERMKKDSQRLCKCLPDATLATGEVRFFLEPSGRVIQKDIAEAVISAKALVSVNDGLFGNSQTYVAPV